MIIADWKPLPELLAFLQGHDRVLLVGCATCVAECATGGEREVETLAPLLRMGTAQAGKPVEIVTHTAERQCEWKRGSGRGTAGVRAAWWSRRQPLSRGASGPPARVDGS